NWPVAAIREVCQSVREFVFRVIRPGRESSLDWWASTVIMRASQNPTPSFPAPKHQDCNIFGASPAFRLEPPVPCSRSIFEHNEKCWVLEPLGSAQAYVQGISKSTNPKGMVVSFRSECLPIFGRNKSRRRRLTLSGRGETEQ